MFVITFKKNNNVNIDFNQRFTLWEGLEHLREFNTHAIDTNSKFFIEYQIIDEVKEKNVLVDKISCGQTYRIDFFQLTRNRLKNLFNGNELEHHLKILEAIEVQYSSEKDQYYADKGTEVLSNLTNKDETKENETLDDNSEKEKKQQKKKTEKKKQKKASNQQLKKIKELPIIPTVSVVLITVLILLIAFLTVNLNNQPSEKPLAPYDELIQERQFSEALEVYPEKYTEVEQEIVELGERGIPYLEDFIKQYPTYTEAQFDLDFLRKDYQSLIEKEEYANTDRRRTQLIIAYIHEDKLNKAQEVNHLIHDEELNKKIDEIYFHLILENIKREDTQKVEEYMQYANSTEINNYVSELNTLNSEINEFESMSEKKRNGFFNRRTFDSLQEERLILLSTNPFNMKETASSRLNSLTLISLPVIFIVIALIVFFATKLIKQLPDKEEESKTFESYLENKKYLVALKEYPHKYPEIERTIFLQGESEIPYLEEFIAKKKNYKQANFDLAFLKKEYQEVVDLEKFADTDGRKTQLAIAYIQLGELDHANDINQFIQIPELSYYLNEHYYHLTVAALRNDDYKLAYEYQELGNSPDVDFLIDTIHLIDKKIDEVNSHNKNTEDPKTVYKLQRLKEAKAMSLNLD